MNLKNISTQNIKGYSNVLSVDGVQSPNNKHVSYISMQLNDQDGCNDLSNFNNILKLISPDQKDTDTLTLSYITKENGGGDLYIGDKALYWGEELLNIKKLVPKKVSENDYKEFVRIHIKLYTFLASITKRMMNDNNPMISRSGLYKVFTDIYNSHHRLFRNKAFSLDLANLGMSKFFNYQAIAKKFNKGIQRSMENFLK